MATVVRNADGTYTVTLTARAEKTLQRWAKDQSRTRANQLEEVISAFLRNKTQDYRQLDGPNLHDRYDAATPAVQAKVDALLPPL